MERCEHLLFNTAKHQRGLFTTEQAKASGISQRSLQLRVSRGIYERIYPGVYGISGSAVDWHRDVVAAVLSLSPVAGASHRTAAYLWGLWSKQPKIIEVVGVRHQRVHRSEFVFHESKDLQLSDLVVIDGIPTTSAVRTVVDLGASAPPWFVEKCLDTALSREIFDIWDVQRFIMRVACKGRNGIGTIRPLVEERLTWEGVTESDLEDLFRRVIASLPYPMPETQLEVFDNRGEFIGRYDFAYPTRMALIETDSESFHMDPVSFQRDRDKQNRAHVLGWTVYRFTWRQLVDNPEKVREMITQIWTV